eukprot:5546820-Amphidinium_carterae.1
MITVGEALAETLVEGEVLEPEGDQFEVEQPETEQSRKKTHCDQAVKTWFLDFADLHKKRFNWTLTRSL